MPKPTAANLAAFALLALHASSLLTIPPLAVNVVVTATAIVYLGCRKGLKLLPGAKAKAAKSKGAAAPQETVTLSAKVDPSLLGGLTVQIGDKYLDLSAATKIGAISRAL